MHKNSKDFELTSLPLTIYKINYAYSTNDRKTKFQWRKSSGIITKIMCRIPDKTFRSRNACGINKTHSNPF